MKAPLDLGLMRNTQLPETLVVKAFCVNRCWR
jgi:hypothetical protein